MADLGRLARLHARLLAAGDDQGPVAGEELCRTCVEALPIDGAAISMMVDEGRRGTVATSDAVADRIEHLQFGLGEGPCIESFTTRRPVLVADWADESWRWPAFADGLEAGSVGAIFALPLQIGAITIGVLDLYRTTPGPLDSALGDALLAADTVTLAVLDAHERGPGDDGGPGEERFSIPLSQTEIHVYQATGLISGELEVSLEEAFARLRAHAFAHNRLVGDTARDILTRRLRLDD
ncbi:GAF and ANTAR domain-containing protein [Halostreptopolyspora alba]|uniref:GAF and ANTAR domain-containing protein n=1 Tax=Halostreptopolyspora alba TaxID=2487137 RepID=UPI003710BA16